MLNFQEGSRFKLFWRKIDASSSFASLTPADSCVQELLINSTATTIVSPNYPTNYDNNINCDWILKSDPSTRIQIFIEDIVMESSARCQYDHIKIYDGAYGTQNWHRIGM